MTGDLPIPRRSVHLPVTCVTDDPVMSMAEPLLPHPSTGSDETVTPGLDHLEETTDEPDVLTGPPEPGAALDTGNLPAPPFRTPVAGESLSPEDLADES